MSKLTITHDIDTVKNFISDLSADDKLQYLFVGKHTPWDDDNDPPEAVLSVVNTELSVYNDIMFGKKITDSDVAMAIPRHDWVANTVYAMYDDIDGDLLDKNFYVLTSQSNVYKCIFNELSLPSTVMPVTVSNSIFELPDGYKWKYMFTLDNQTSTKFLTTDYVPVSNNQVVIDAAVPGTIDYIMITDDGYDYRTYHSGNLVYVSNSEFVTIANTASSEDNFYKDSGIYLSSGLGAGQVRKIKAYDGATKMVAVDEPFEIYSILTVDNPQGLIEVDQVIKQKYTRLTVEDKEGYFRKEEMIGALGVIQQVDTLATGKIAYANDESMIVEIIGTTDFLINGYPIINKDDGGSQMKGVVGTSKIFVCNTSSGNTYVQCNVASGFAATVNKTSFFKDTAVSGTSIAADSLIVSANNTHIQLSKAATATGTNVNLTLSNKSLVFGTGNTALPSIVGPTSFTFETAAKKYIRLGPDIARHVRKVDTVGNDTVLRVNKDFVTSLTDNWIYQIHHAFTAQAATLGEAYGIITSINLDSVKIKVSNLTKEFTVGETVSLLEKNGINTGHTAVVTFSGSSNLYNDTTLIASQVSNLNAFYNYDLQIVGTSSGAVANMTNTSLFPSITYREVSGKIIEGVGFSTYIDTTSQAVLGTGVIVGKTFTPDTTTQYIISPYVQITGDGTGAMGYTVVDGTANAILKIEMINPGSHYSFANVAIQANSFYGNTATARAIISPFYGHGSNPPKELGAKYACISVDFKSAVNESYKFPGYGQFRKLGILKSPTYDVLYFNMCTPSTANVTLTSVTGTLTEGDYLTCDSCNSIGKIKTVDGNSLVITDIKNNGDEFTVADTVTTFPTGATGTISAFSYNLFANTDIITQETTGATAVVEEVISDTLVRVTNVSGKFIADDTGMGPTVYNESGNSGACIDSIKVNDNTYDVSTSYSDRFSQLTRIALTGNTGAFEVNALVTQTVSEAAGFIYNTTKNLDIVITNLNGVFNAGGTLVDSTSSANGYILFANTTYVKLTSVSGTFGVGHYVTTPQGGIATVSAVRPVLMISENTKKFLDGNGAVYIQQTMYANGYQGIGATGYHSTANTITRPELTRDSGDVIYIENTSPVTRSATSREEFRIVIKM
jgi:hypothetical protein